MQRPRELIGRKASTARRAAATLQPLGGNSPPGEVAHQALLMGTTQHCVTTGVAAVLRYCATRSCSCQLKR